MTEATKLVGSGRSGDAVLNSQKMAVEEGFKNTNQSWWKRTSSYEDGFKLLAKHAKDGEDILSKVGNMVPTVRENGEFSFFHKPTARFFVPTDYAMGQVGKWGFGSPHYFSNLLGNDGPNNVKGEPIFRRDREDREVLVHAINNGWRRIDPEKPFLFRVNNSEGSLRAMLSDSYAPINNEWFLQTLQKLIPGGRLSHWDKSDSETIWGNVLIPDSIRKEDDSDYGGMLSVGNSQIGERSLYTQPSLFRAICMNGCIWDQEKGASFKKKHLGKVDLESYFEAIRKNLDIQIPLLTSGIEKFLNTRNLKYNGQTMKPLFAEVVNQGKFSKKQAKEIWNAYGEEASQKNLFGLINAITRAGQTFKAEDWYRCDVLAGDFLQYDNAKWQRFVNRAESLTAQEVDSVFALAN